MFRVLTRLLQDELARGRRVLLGVDFALGYPAGFARAAGLTGTGPAWARTWAHLEEHIVDGVDNANNRFAVAAALNQRCAERRTNAPGTRKNRPRGVGVASESDVKSSGGPGEPFWGCPPTQAGRWLSPRRAGLDSPLPRRRLVEQRLPTAHEVWKLYTTGSVGSQTLLGIARLAQLRRHPALRDHLRVWPFETGFTPTPLPAPTPGSPGSPGIVVAEVYPSLVNDRADALLAERDDVTIRDQAQVLALAEHFARRDRAGRLAPLFDTPRGLTAADSGRCAAEEGWVLGV